MKQFSRKNIINALQLAFDDYVNVVKPINKFDRKSVLQFKKWLPNNSNRISVVELNAEYSKLSDRWRINDHYDRFDNWFQYVK